MARKEFKFWLDDKRASDWQLHSLIDQLKAARQFSRSIRQGLQLWQSLREGRVDILLEMFPFVREALTKTTPAPAGGAGDSGQLNEIKAMLETIAAGQHVGGYLMQSAPAPGPKPLAAGKLPAPVFEDDIDDMPTVILKKAASNSSQTFLNMMKSLNNKAQTL